MQHNWESSSVGHLRSQMNFSITVRPDASGYTGRECPRCRRYFKIKFGTGLPNSTDCHCPYCNHVAPQTQFWTEQQIEYAKSVALNKITSDFLSQLKRIERRPNPRSFLSIGITVRGSPIPIAYYSEMELEEQVECSVCALQYTIYGAFGFCPDCGSHNSLQIVQANFEVVLKTIQLAQTASKDVKQRLIENALEDTVSCFDGFGREQCAGLPFNVSFQSIDSAQKKLLRELGVDISAGLTTDQWNFVCEQFQKRHLLAHKLGVIDAEYVAKTGSALAFVGRKVAITEADVRSLVDHMRTIASTLYGAVKPD